MSPLVEWFAAGQLIMLSEGFAVHEAWLRTKPEVYGELFHDRIIMGAFVSAADYVQAQRRRRELLAEMHAAFGEVDLLLTASAPGEAPTFESMPKNRAPLPSHNTPFNVTGFPAISLCCGFGAGGMPLAVQLAAKPFAEALLLRAAHSYECETEWRRHRPSLAPPVDPRACDIPSDMPPPLAHGLPSMTEQCHGTDR